MDRLMRRLNPHFLLIGILVLRCMLSIPIVLQPYWVEHEADFYNVARFIARQGRLPSPTDFPDQGGVLLQTTQPPLFYVSPCQSSLCSTAISPYPHRFNRQRSASDGVWSTPSLAQRVTQPGIKATGAAL